MKKLLTLMMALLMSFMVVATAQPTYAAAFYDHEVTFDMNGGDYLHEDLKDFGDTLDASYENQTVLVIGDSTSNDLNDWFYLMGDSFAEEIPNYTVEHRLWNNTNDSFDTVNNISYGTDGDAYALFDGTANNNITVLDSDELSITGDIDLRAKINFEPGENGVVFAKWGTGGSSYFLYFYNGADDNSGTIKLYWNDGTTTSSVQSTAFSYTEDEDIWIQATLDVDNGTGYTVDFNFSYNGLTYTDVSEEVTSSGTTSINDTTTAIEVGTRDDGAAEYWSGKLYAVEIREGIDGKVVAALDLDGVKSDQRTVKDVEGNTWVINNDVEVGYGAPGLLLLNGSISGAKISTFDATTLNNMINVDIDIVMINLGHNEGTNDSYAEILESFIDTVQIYTDNAPVVLITQNPKVSPVTDAYIQAHDIRTDQIKLVAARNNYVLLDSGTKLSEDTSSYIDTDGIHPTTTGSAIWADEVADMLTLAVKENGLSSTTILVEDGELIVPIDEPVKSGSTFIGWYTNENLTNEWDLDVDLVQDDMTLYAKWSDTTSSGGIFTSPSGTYQILGIDWYWVVIAAAALGYLIYINAPKKKTSSKKRRR